MIKFVLKIVDYRKVFVFHRFVFGALSILLTLMGPNRANAESDNCFSNDIKSIKRPLENGESFEFKYRYIVGSNPNSPVVINLPGGPGQTSIQNQDPRLFSDYGFIQTDPRGTGCNRSYWNASYHDVSIDRLAEDIVAIIKHENLNNVILFGTSFGTVLATAVAYKFEDEPNSPIQSLVLQGAVGRAFKIQEGGFVDYLKEWALQTQDLQIAVKDRLKEKFLPYNLSPGQWGSAINNWLQAGKNPQTGRYYIAEELSRMVTHPEEFKDYLNLFKQGFPQDMIEVYKRIGCKEIIPNWEMDTYLENGRLIRRKNSNDICEDFKLDKPFDSAQFKIKAKIYYFNGTNDPATPIWQAQYHSQSQSFAERIVVTVPGGGHNALSFNLRDCNKRLWNRILNQKTDLKPALRLCSLNPTIEVIRSN